MSSSGFFQHSVDMSASSVDELEIRAETARRADGPILENKFTDNFDGYAEFVNHMAQHQVPIFAERIHFENATYSVIGQGGTYVVRTAKLSQRLHSQDSQPFLLKASDEALASGCSVKSSFVEKGTAVVTKHIDFRNLKQRRAERRVAASEFLKPYQTEATILSHPPIRAHPAFPSLLGIGLEFSPDDVGEMPQLYPYMIMELGRQGSMEQSFRELWYRLLQTLPGSPGQYDLSFIYRIIVIPWTWSLSQAREISLALSMLHHLGVVHGDVKLSNTFALISVIGTRQRDQGDHELIMSGNQLTQVGDFGSSILLSEIPPGGKARLRFHSPPWNAPESESEIHRDDLVKTDIYSYGLLFGRIMLQGASPFDEEVDAVSLLGCGLPKHDFSEIQRLRDSDTMDEHIYDTIRKRWFYSSDQLQVIRTVLRRTLRTKIEDRVGTMDAIYEYLSNCQTSGSSGDASIVWNQPKGTITPLSLGDNVQVDVQIHNLWDDCFIRPLSVPDGEVVPNILDPAFAEFRSKRVLLREVFEDFKQQIAHNLSENSHMAQVHYQTAMCHFNGWGTNINIGHCRTHLFQALRLGSIDALWRFQPVLGSPLIQSRHPTFGVDECPELYHATLEHFPDHVEMFKAIQLQNVSADSFQMALSKARSNYFEYSDGTRLEISGLLSRMMQDALNSGTEPSYRRIRHDVYAETPQGHEDFADPPFTALCIAAAQGEMDSIFKLFNHLENELGLKVKDYLNRSTELMIMDIRVVEIDRQAQSARDIWGPLPALQFKLEANTHPLMMACSNGHSGVALLLLAQGADPSQVDVMGRCPLHYLARFDPDQVEKVGNLLLQGQKDILIDRVDNDGHSPLAFVLDVERNWVPGSGVAAATFLLKKGASWYNKDNPIAMLKSPFTKAVQSLNIQAMELVRDSVQRNINDRPQEGNDRESSSHLIPAPQGYSFVKHDTDYNVDFEQSLFLNEIVNAMIALSQQPDSVLTEREGTYGTTLARVIQFLISSTHPKASPCVFAPVVKQIVTHGAVRMAMTLSATLPSFDWSSEGMHLLDASLSLAARNFPGMLVTLVQLGFKIDQVTRSEWFGGEVICSFFHVAGLRRIPVDLVKYICQVSPIDHRATERDSSSLLLSMNAFDMAVIYGHFKLADYLIDQGADTGSPHLFAMKSSSGAVPGLTILGFLLVAVIPEVQNTPRTGKMLRYLLGLNPDPLACPSLEQNVFHLVWRKWALISKDYFHPENDLEHAFDEVMDVFKQLHDHFADFNLLTARDVDGATPLHLAAGSGNIRAIRRLLQLGVNAAAKDNDGMLPIDYAVRAMRHALNSTLSGDSFPIEIDPKEVIGPILDFVVQNQLELKQGRLDRLARSVVLSRVLESVRKRRQDQNDRGEISFRTRHEEPTEILALVEVFVFLSQDYPE